MKLFFYIVMFCGCAITAAGGLALTLIIVGYLWNKALDISLKAFGENTKTWWDILLEMQQTKRLRFQRKSEKGDA